MTPNALTWLGFIFTIGAAQLIITEHLFIAGFIVLVAGFIDMLDGALARRLERVTIFGGVLDSTLDRLSDAALFVAILVYFDGETWRTLLVSLALVGSLLVSYIRARAEAAGVECQVGLFTRAERVIVLALGLLFSHWDNALTIALIVIVAFSFFTAGQRLVCVWRRQRGG
jgi:CDP-diacylglycerol--glycerol-3-phosphate 3-phosphatidyltransferase